MEDWGAVKARLDKVLAESAEVVNILPDRTTQWDISDDIRAALERVEELERDKQDWARRWTLNGVTVWDWMSRAEAAEAKLARCVEGR